MLEGGPRSAVYVLGCTADNRLFSLSRLHKGLTRLEFDKFQYLGCKSFSLLEFLCPIGTESWRNIDRIKFKSPPTWPAVSVGDLRIMLFQKRSHIRWAFLQLPSPELFTIHQFDAHFLAGGKDVTTEFDQWQWYGYFLAQNKRLLRLSTLFPTPSSRAACVF